MKSSRWLPGSAVALVLVAGSAHANPLSMYDIEDLLEEQGYDVDDVAIAGRAYEVTVESADGTLLKWLVDPTNGQQISEVTSISENDDDDDEDEDDEEDGRDDEDDRDEDDRDDDEGEDEDDSEDNDDEDDDGDESDESEEEEDEDD